MGAVCNCMDASALEQTPKVELPCGAVGLEPFRGGIAARCGHLIVWDLLVKHDVFSRSLESSLSMCPCTVSPQGWQPCLPAVAPVQCAGQQDQ